MEKQNTTTQHKLQQLLNDCDTTYPCESSVSPLFWDGISSMIDDLNINDLTDMKICTHHTNETFYIEFLPVKRHIPFHKLEELFKKCFQLEDNNNKRSSKNWFDIQPYKLYQGPMGLKMEVENQNDRIKLFRFIIPLQ
jgi:hypothetical protein